jgi:hypothetical protein
LGKSREFCHDTNRFANRAKDQSRIARPPFFWSKIPRGTAKGRVGSAPCALSSITQRKRAVQPDRPSPNHKSKA